MSSGWTDPRRAAAAQRFSVARLSARSNTLRVSKRAPNARHSTETVLASPDCSDNADGEWRLIIIYVFTRTALCVILLRAWRHQAGRLRLPPAYERWCRARLQGLSGSRLTGFRALEPGRRAASTRAAFLEPQLFLAAAAGAHSPAAECFVVDSLASFHSTLTIQYAVLISIHQGSATSYGGRRAQWRTLCIAGDSSDDVALVQL